MVPTLLFQLKMKSVIKHLSNKKSKTLDEETNNRNNGLKSLYL